MKFFKKVGSAIHSRAFTYTSFVLSVFAAVHWDENGNMNFGEMGEEKFAQELAALKEIIAKRQNQSHRVKLIVTALADGAWGDGHNGVNIYMASHWEKVADQITALVKKYDFDGADIDWEYPASTDDCKYYNVPDAGQIYDGTFCSPALAGDKTAYAMLSGAGGAMVFRVGCDRLIDDQNSVTGGIEDTLNRYVTGW